MMKTFLVLSGGARYQIEADDITQAWFKFKKENPELEVNAVVEIY